MERDDVAKRRAYRRKKARKRHLLIGFFIFLLVGTSVFIALSLTLLFPVKSVTYTGSKIYSQQQLEENMNVKGKNIFTISEKSIADSARKKLPYVESVKITRTFPDTVKVEITDAKEYAAYYSSGRYYVVNSDGYVLSRKISKPENTVEIRAKNLKLEIGEKVVFSDDYSQEVINSIIDMLGKKHIRIDYIDITVKSELTAGILNNRFKVNFGTKQNIDKKIAHLAKMLEKMEEGTKGTINLSVWTENDPTGILVKDEN